MGERAIQDRKLVPAGELKRRRNQRTGTSDKDELEIIQASTVKPRAIRWVWPSRIAEGKITVFAGNPGASKTLLLIAIIAIVSRGGLFPMNEGRSPKRRVLVLSTEDDIADTLVPRLIAAGADMNYVSFVPAVKTEGGRRGVDLSIDIDRFRKEIAKYDDVGLMTFDPLTAYVEDDTSVSRKVQMSTRSILTALKILAEETGVAIVAIMHFNKKTDVVDAMTRIAGNRAYTAVARGVYTVSDDRENNRKLFLNTKLNIGLEPKGLSYTIRVVTIGVDEDTREAIVAPCIAWGDSYVDTSSNEAIQQEVDSDQKKIKGSRAKTFVRDALADGPVNWNTILGQAKSEGEKDKISASTLRRARDDLAKEGVIAFRRFGSGDSVWFMVGDTRLAPGEKGDEAEMPF